MNSLLTDLIPQKVEVAQNFWSEFHVPKGISFSILNRFQQMMAQNLSYSVYNLKVVVHY